MSKTIPIDLLEHKQQASTTLTDLMQIGPLEDGSYRGLTLLDVPVTYDGCVDPFDQSPIGTLTFHARTGMELSQLNSTADTGVDNAEANTLLAVGSFELEGITQAQIDSGALDKVSFLIYRVNYADLAQGHEIVGVGTLGEIRRTLGGLATMETRSLSNQGKQTVGELDSRLCRVKRFGSQPGEERFPCGYDLAPEWVAGEVTEVTELDRVFATDLAQADDYFAPGVVRWTSGANAGTEQEVESFLDGVVTLQYTAPQAIEVGDEYEIRRDCSRSHEGHNSCQTFFAAEWVLHLRGEPWLPVGDAANLLAPGADPNYLGSDPG